MFAWRLCHTGYLTRPRPRSIILFWATVAIFFASILGGLAVVSQAADEPQPDPAGIATGDKTNAIDASGNPFVVVEPTDKADPDFTKKRSISTHTRIRSRKSHSR